MNESSKNKKEEITEDQTDNTNKKQISTENEQSKKQDSRVMNFFNQEFIERKIDFKPKKQLNDPKSLPEEIKSVVKSSSIFEKLLEMEKQIDEKMYKTRLDIQEKLIMPTPKVKALLRTHIFSYFLPDQDEMQVDDDEDGVMSNRLWVLRLQGKIMPVLDTQPGGFYRKFSYFFQKIVINFSEENAEQYQDIEWVRTTNTDVDGFEIKRPSKTMETIKLKILLYLNLYTQELKVSDQLASVIGITQDTRPRILYHIWQYIKINSLQDNENPNIIINNKDFQQIFGCERMDIVSLTSRLVDHIKTPDPIEIKFEVKPLNDWTQCQALHDIVVNIDDPHFSDISNFLSNVENESILFPKSLYFTKNDSQQKSEKTQQTFAENFYSKIQEYDRNMNDLLEKLKKHKYKHDFYEAFSKDPIKFINNFLIQQNSLIKIMAEEAAILDARCDYNSFQYYKDYEEVLREYVENYCNKQSK